MIDFTTPAATIDFATLATQARTVHMIGTTGLSDNNIKAIDTTAHHAMIMRAGNMSLSINLLVKLTQTVTTTLDPDFDIKIVETHHNQKVNAPSNTTLILGKATATKRSMTLSNVHDTYHDEITNTRTHGNIGFSTIRNNNIISKHNIIFATASKQIILHHLATNHAIFAHSALKTAL